MSTRIVVAALAAFSGTVYAQGGYFDFSQVPGLGDEPTVQIDLNPALLAFVSAAAQETDPQAAEVLKTMQNIRVRVYEDLEDPAAVHRFVEDSSGRLERDGWQRAVYIQEDDEKVRIYVKFEGQQAVGMTVMVVDGVGGGGDDGDDGDDSGSGGEAVFINIAGPIDPAKLGQIANGMGMGGIFDSIIGAPPTGR